METQELGQEVSVWEVPADEHLGVMKPVRFFFSQAFAYFNLTNSPSNCRLIVFVTEGEAIV